MPQFGTCMVLSRHRTGTSLLLRLYGVRRRLLLGMGWRMFSPNTADGGTDRDGYNDHSFHFCFPFCFG
jgi:hypothetical protein